MADGDSNEIFLEMDSSVTVTYSDIQQDANVYPGIGNINLNPLFKVIEPGKYYLRAGSPCIDAGTLEDAPAGDQAGIARPQGPGIDMGAYEYVDPVSCTPRALFTVAHTTGTDSLTVYFDASASGASQYNGAGFAWEFGDGGTGNGMIVSHTYSRYSSYDVSLTVTTECGEHKLGGKWGRFLTCLFMLWFQRGLSMPMAFSILCPGSIPEKWPSCLETRYCKWGRS